MWKVFEEVKGVKTLFATCWSESMAWLLCRENTSVYSIAKGIRYTYERA